MSKQIITVFGATGNQGGSVAKLILNTPALASKYGVRAVTRDTSKPAAKALSDKGAELVVADLNDPASLRKAIAGSYGVFAVTNFWESMNKDTEVQQGKNVVDASKAEGVKHFVWSSLAHATTISGGALKHIQHFDGKAEIEQYAHEVKGSSLIVSSVMPGFFSSNLKAPGTITKGPDGIIRWTSPAGPNANFPTFDPADDLGKYVVGVLEAGEAANGANVHAVGEWITPKDIVAILSELSGQDVTFNSIDAKTFEGYLPEKIAKELTENFLLISDYDYYGKGAPAKQADSDKFLYEGTKPASFKEWATANGPWKW